MPTAIKERGILMHARSVLNILAGRKTQTRRIIKPQPLGFADTDDIAGWESGNTALLGQRGHYRLVKLYESGSELLSRQGIPRDVDYPCPYGQPGDRLWVRETHLRNGDDVLYADDEDYDLCYPAKGKNRAGGINWRVAPGIHMPRWASRITLEITDVRVERVQDISDADAIAEGITSRPNCTGYGRRGLGWSGDWSRVGKMSLWAETSGEDGKRVKAPLTERDIALGSPRFAFGALWNDTNGKGAWERNDWVWALTFKVVTP